MGRLSRRGFIWSGAGFAALSAPAAEARHETVYHFATPGCDIRMSVDFYDRYASNGFWFDNHGHGHRFCLSSSGEEGRNCLMNFSGSLAVAHYHIRHRSTKHDLIVLREHVRTIDRDSRVALRDPFERTLQVQNGVASDIQAFGYDADASIAAQVLKTSFEPWCLFRQDLYFNTQSAPFLVVHWKHTLSAISLLDIIPGENTRLMEK